MESMTCDSMMQNVVITMYACMHAYMLIIYMHTSPCTQLHTSIAIYEWGPACMVLSAEDADCKFPYENLYLYILV